MTRLLAAAPALPLHTAGKYVAAAYIVFLVLVLVYVAIMARRLSRTERELVELQRDLKARDAASERDDDPAETDDTAAVEPVA
jgi:type II secretory pathway component PulM